jgi:predicted  nucleic acid-binding Zn-ribbon protein
MFKCERCGAGYSPSRAAILEFCPRCWARDQVRVPLVVKVVRDSPSCLDKQTDSSRLDGTSLPPKDRGS